MHKKITNQTINHQIIPKMIQDSMDYNNLKVTFGYS